MITEIKNSLLDSKNIGDKPFIFDDLGNKQIAVEPIIISASRSTDIPAFYSDWLINRIKRGYVKWKNPFNGMYSYVSFAKSRLFVFWSKNPQPMLNKLSFFDENGYHYYFQYTLNDYQAEGFEPNLPSIEDRIDTFISLSNRIGKNKVIWRFDPIIVCNSLYPDEVLNRIKSIGDSLNSYTERMVFSFIDISCYKKVKTNLGNMQSEVIELDKDTIDYMARGIADLNRKWGFQLGTCAESVDLDKYDIEHNRCIDDRLIVKLFRDDPDLMRFIGIDEDQLEAGFLSGSYSYEKLIDKGQRNACGCIKSKDIGQYDTCPHGCIYCYANTNHETATRNYRKTSQESETLF